MSGERAHPVVVSPEGPRADKSPTVIAGMFDAIAGRYDFLNHLLSGGLDLYWRKRAVQWLALSGRELVLDLCAGTADLTVAVLRGGARRAIGIDFAHEMLRVGRTKLERRNLVPRAQLVRGDAMRLPLASASVDACTIAFGIRNVLYPEVALTDILRVLRPGGRLAILEFSTPTAPVLRTLYQWYFTHVLPRVGRLVSRHGDAYTYLPVSVGQFASPVEFGALLAAAGFAAVDHVRLTLGVVYLYTARKPG